MKKILIIEVVLIVASELSISLKKWSFEVDIIKNFDNILKEVIYNKPSLILMDVNLPYYDGFYWCEKIRKVSKVPIIFLSSRDSNIDIILGINNGADDYITKPFSTEVLISKINALLRRSYDYNNSDTLIYYNDAVLDIEKCIFRYDDKEIELTKNEIKILSLLIKNKEKVVSREKIMMSLWNDDEFVNDNTLTVNITRLRGKINELGLKDIIKTKKGIGYLIK